MKARDALTLFVAFITGCIAYALASRDDSTPPPIEEVTVRHATSGVAQSPYQTEQDRAAASALNLLLEENSLRQMATLGPLLDILGPAQMKRLADQAEILESRRPLPALSLLIAEWTRRDPVAATAWIRFRLDACPTDEMQSYTQGAEPHGVCEWARNAPDIATEYALSHPYCTLSPAILASALEGRSIDEVGEVFQKLTSLPRDSEREAMMFGLRIHWQAKDLDGTLAAISALPPGEFRERTLVMTLADAQILKRDIVATLDLAVAHGVIDSREATRLFERATGDPDRIAAWLEEHGKIGNGPLAHAFVGKWAETDVAAAFDWATKHGISLTRTVQSPDSTRTLSPLLATISQNFSKALAWATTLPAGRHREGIMEFLSSRLTTGLNSETITRTQETVLSELSPEGIRGWMTQFASLPTISFPDVVEWANSLTGPHRAAAWQAIGYTSIAAFNPDPALPVGPDRDWFMRGRALDFDATQEPLTAFARTTQIQDTELQFSTQEDLCWRLVRHETLGNPTVRKSVDDWLTQSNLTAARKSALRAILENAEPSR